MASRLGLVYSGSLPGAGFFRRVALLGVFGAYHCAAEPEIVRLRPSVFKELPGNIVTELQRRGCTIPQIPYIKKRHNVVRGTFARPGQVDWAVLCSIRGASRILVFWDGSDKNPATLARAEDSAYIQGLGEGKSGFSRIIAPAGKDYIVIHSISTGGVRVPLPPRVDHQGINDAVAEKGSEIHYFYRGKWLKLAGSD